MMASPARKKRIVITALIASSFLLLSAPSNPFILDGTYGSQPLRLGMQPGVDEDLLSLIIADDYSADRQRERRQRGRRQRFRAGRQPKEELQVRLLDHLLGE